MHIVRSTSLKYSKVRQFQEHFQFDVCRHEVRYGCLREDSCHFAHSFIELKVWLLQQYSGEGEGLHSSEEGSAGLWGCRGAGASWTSQDAQALHQGACGPRRPWVSPCVALPRGHVGRGGGRQSPAGHLGDLVISGPSLSLHWSSVRG